MFRLPQTALGFALEITLSLMIAYTLVSVLEHFIHRNLMHLHKLPKLVYRLVPHLHIVYSDHAIEHHGRFYKEFDWEPDLKGRHVNIVIRPVDTAFMAIPYLPAMALIAIVSPIFFVTACAVSLVHNLTWGIIHTEMHMPKDSHAFKRTRLYRFLARHHFMHHVRPLKNMNVVFPLADWLFGSVAVPRQRDVKAMLRMGYLLPRNSASAARVARLQAVTAERRAAVEQQLAVDAPVAVVAAATA